MIPETQVVSNISTSKIAQGVDIPDVLRTLILDHRGGRSLCLWGARDHLDKGGLTIPLSPKFKQPLKLSWKRHPAKPELTLPISTSWFLTGSWIVSYLSYPTMSRPLKPSSASALRAVSSRSRLRKSSLASGWTSWN